MRDKVIFFAITLLCSLVPAVAYADSIPISSLSEFEAIATSGGEAKLEADFEISDDIFIRKDLILDLNGHTISNFTTDNNILSLANLTIKDTSPSQNGRIYATKVAYPLYCGVLNNDGNCILESGNIVNDGSATVAVVNGKFTINGGNVIGYDNVVVVKEEGILEINGGRVYTATGRGIASVGGYVELNNGLVQTEADDLAIALTDGSIGVMNGGEVKALYRKEGTRSGGNGIFVYKNSTFTMNGGKVSSCGHALGGNGAESGQSTSINAKITLNGGTVENEIGAGIYSPMINGVTEINGGEIISGNVGVEIRAGSLYITGGTITSTDTVYKVVKNDSGSTTYGAAVGIAQHNTKRPIDVHICGGTFNAIVPFSEANSQGNPQTATDQILADINRSCGEPTFNATSGDVVVSEDLRGFITGGTFSGDLDDIYVTDGYGEKDASGKIIVYPLHTITILNSGNGSIKASKRTALYSDVIKISSTPDNDYMLSSVLLTESSTGTRYDTYNLDSFTMPDDNVTLLASFKNVPEPIPDPDPEPVRPADVNPITADEKLTYICLFIASISMIVLAHYARL